MVSIVTPAFNEAQNLDQLYARLTRAADQLGVEWEWLVIDDHSRDETFEVIERLSSVDRRVRGIRLARNSGSHVAITCGLHHAQGDAAVVLAADLQDPPEMLPAMLDSWRSGAQVVWAARRARPGERTHAGFAAVYYYVMRRLIGMKEMPARGADSFLVDRVVIDAFRRYPERNVSVLALITSLGFRQAQIEYDKQPRAAGRSGWTLARKIRLVVDSVTAFSDLPIRLCSYAGVALIVVSVLVAIGGVSLLPTLGGGALLLVAMMIGLSGMQMLALGLMGEYLWRTLEEARRRPQYLVERIAGRHVPAGEAAGSPGRTW